MSIIFYLLLLTEALLRFIQGEGSRVSIVCTQPRRVAAISVAERVAAERGETIGDTVGYQARLFHFFNKLYCVRGGRVFFLGRW